MASNPTRTPSSSSPLPIIIIGSGLGGLLLAQGLRRANIPFRIYERDAAPSTRPQGYRIRISGAGIDTLESTLPLALFQRFADTCAHNPCGRAYGRRHPTGGDRAAGAAGEVRRRPYTPDRATMRGVLMEGLEPFVSFGKAFVGYDVGADGNDDQKTCVTARFADGTTSVRGRLLVGADGARSRVRRQYLGGVLRPVDTRGRVLYGKTPLTGKLRGRMGEGLLDVMRVVEDQSRGEGAPVTCLYEPIRFPQRGEVGGLPEDYVYWVLIARKEALGVEDDELVRMTSEQAGELVLRVTAKWHLRLRSLFELAEPDQTAAMRVLSMRPDMATWDALREPVTLLGDAAHVMSPSGGVGAVTAFRDAANLAKALVESDGQVSAETVGKYEQMMREYAAEAIESSRQGGVRFFNHPPFDDCEEVDV
ncbi:hypothetical protein B0J12DRAFT_570099 [Macrophomina phaseolina]|uniref:FAD-binding domain-containing protein n=1 Tax=Macrophomina phaseolina TaxID=35725 RepID=A0ABQ8GFQ9_9PEZI|nr:hypothetical protein B0J12DRAFT_570099 [Macrophomina phaseolina]